MLINLLTWWHMQVRAWLRPDEQGDALLEYIVLGAIVLAFVGLAAIALVQALAGRFEALAGSL
ncbi:MAG: hypothetical protein KKA73_21565 [Chloroflexi bacterium]|nr:hypothetical protein [Chloroflexota bacterium]MBU1750283.1 hypothetical protein [Chloroflexota bacterium]